MKISDLVFPRVSRKSRLRHTHTHIQYYENNHAIVHEMWHVNGWLHNRMNNNVNVSKTTFSLANRVMNMFSSFYHSLLGPQMNANLCHNSKCEQQDHNFKCTLYTRLCSLILLPHWYILMQLTGVE